MEQVISLLVSGEVLNDIRFSENSGKSFFLRHSPTPPGRLASLILQIEDPRLRPKAIRFEIV